MTRRAVGCLVILFISIFSSAQKTIDSSRPLAEVKLSSQQRVIVLTDMGADPDDAMSLVRLLTYSNVIDVRGVVATTSVFQKARIEPETVARIVDAYRQARPHLIQHEAGYPTYETLAARLKKGLPVYGMEGVGEGKDSEGSNWIISELQRPESRPLWVSIWGGPNTLAQALWKIRKSMPSEKAEALYKKLRVYAISDQDDSGAWIRREFPSLFYICTPGPFERAIWTGLVAPQAGANNAVISREWIAKNIQQGHGPLGAVYPDIAYGMEGDTPSYLALIPNGLSNPEHPDYGGWGGRYQLYLPQFDGQDWKPNGPNLVKPVPETRPLWTNGEDTYTPAMDRRLSTNDKEAEPIKSAQVTLWRWREEIQSDFAARICWATKTYKECNHPPVVVLRTPEEINVRSGEGFVLDATGSHDPDGDSLSYFWFQYPEAGDYPGLVDFHGAAHNTIRMILTAPSVDSPKTIHFILKVSDKGEPALTRYKRILVHVRP